jgi:GNAT superfamily N-acetyltransferase
VSRNGTEIARAYLYLMHNDLHSAQFGLLEDVFVEDNERGNGVGSELVREVLKVAKEKGCYKLIATSRDARTRVHELYKNLGFEDYGREFRINFDSKL